MNAFPLVFLSFRKFSHFLSIHRYSFHSVLFPYICHQFWFYVRAGYFCEIHAFNLGLQLTLSFIEKTCHPRDVPYKGCIIQGNHRPRTNSQGHIGRGHIVAASLKLFQLLPSSLQSILLFLTFFSSQALLVSSMQLLFVPSSLILLWTVP